MKFGRRIGRIATLAALLLVAAAVVTASSTRAAPNTAPAASDIDPANFVRQVDNKFFPLVPGTTFFYEGERDGVPSTTETFVTHQTKEILGVKTTAVHDRVFERGILAEDTFDWYAQDRVGNVWYFGEDTKELDANGNVTSTEGSFEAGVNGAHAGIIMEAAPRKGDRYQEEFSPGVAEDMAQVLSLTASTCVPYGCFNDLLLTKEWTPLERGVVEQKYYAENVGFVFSVIVKGGDEVAALVRITAHP